MKILHTSDWHIGRAIRGRSRADEHRLVLAEIAHLADSNDVDIVLVAGDVFDNGAPSAEAESIAYEALLNLADTGAHVVVLAGNHDNPRRWAALQPLLERTTMHVSAEVRPADRGGVIDLPTRSGEVARVALVPFLSKGRIVGIDQLMGRADAHAARYAERAKRIIAALSESFSSDTVNIVAAHLTVASGAPVLGGGEMQAHTIFDYVVRPEAFPASAHYVALGHLHQPHQIPGPCPIWYSGSPLALDFGEAERVAKAVLLVDVTADTPAVVTEVALEQGTPLRTVRGTVEELREQAERINSAHTRVVVTEPLRAGLADEVRELFPTVVDVTIARPEAEADSKDETVFSAEELRGSPLDLFAEYCAERQIEDPDMQSMFAELVEEVLATDSA